MADLPFSGLPPVTVPLPADEFGVNQNGVSKKVTRQQIHTLAFGERLSLPLGNNPALPELGFGDGLQGIYEEVGGLLAVAQGGVKVAGFNTPALGGMFVNNTLTGAGVERVLTESDKISFGEYIGSFDASLGTFPADATNQGDWYNTTVGGTVDGQVFIPGDILVSLVDSPSTTTFLANWSVVPNISVTDHSGLTSIGTNTHAQIDTHIADTSVHFAQGSIAIPAAQITDFAAAVAATASVLANTAKVSYSDLGNVLLLTGNQTVAGQKTFNTSSLVKAVRINAAPNGSDLGLEINVNTRAIGEAASAVISFVNRVNTETWRMNVDGSTVFSAATTVPEATVTAHQAALSITESQISNLQSYSLVGHTHVAANITDFAAAVAATAAVTANTAKISYTDAAAVALNTAKVTNATHTGDATGATALTLAVAAITTKAALTTGLVGTDELLVNNGGVLNRMDVSVMNAYFNANLSFAAVSHTHVAANITDFASAVSANASVAANTAKVTNATHTGDVTGSGALTLAVAAITTKTALTTGLVGTDELLVSDAGVIKRMDISVMNAYFNANLSFTNNIGDITNVTAGNGLTGGGASGSVTVTMGTPGTTTGSSANAVTATSHTHAFSAALANLSNVVLTSAQSGDFLKFNGTNWINSLTFEDIMAFTNVSQPFTVTSSTVITNLNANLLQGNTAANFIRSNLADSFSGNLSASGAAILMNDNDIRRPVLEDYAVESATATPTGTTQTVTYSTANIWEVDLESVSGNLTITLSGGPPAGTYGLMEVKCLQDSTVVRTITWAGGTFLWAGGAAHPLTTTLNGTSIFVFETWNGGTTWHAVGADYS